MRAETHTHNPAKLQWREDGSHPWDRHTQLPVVDLGQLGEISCDLLCCRPSDDE